MPRLTDFPDAIASLQQQLLSLEDQINPVKDEIIDLDNEFDAMIAFDCELKNDNQRKARRSELQAKDCWYQELITILKDLTHKKQEMLIYLELRRNQFAVAKLEARSAIALTEERASA